GATIMLSRITIFILLVAAILTACAPAATPEVISTETVVESYAGRKIAFVDSYHEGYEWSDGIVAGFHSILDNTGAELLFVRMDTKRNTDEEFRTNAGRTAYDTITKFQPDVIVACDDNAQKYLIVPYFMET